MDKKMTSITFPLYAYQELVQKSAATKGRGKENYKSLSALVSDAVIAHYNIKKPLEIPTEQS